MNKRNLDTYEATSGIDRGLNVAQRIAESLAKRGANPEEIAAEFKKTIEMHRRWVADAERYHQLVGWYEKELTEAERGSAAGKMAAGAIEYLGEVLERNRVIGY